MKIIIGIIWLVFAILLMVFFDKNPECTIMVWGCIVIANIYISREFKDK